MSLEYLLTSATAALTLVASLASVLYAFRSLSRERLGRSRIEPSEDERQQAKALISAVAAPEKEPVPFETEQLAQYYAQVLAQSKTSFWFSITFASLGFLVIVVAVFLYTDAKSGATIAQVVAGAIMDAVAALFFVQSRNAQRAMGDFFDKLRSDRQQAESRALCESIERMDLRDALRAQLALYYAGLQNSHAVAAQVIAHTTGRPMPAPTETE